MSPLSDAGIIVIGSGVAGLSAALAAAEAGTRALVLTAGPALSGSSWSAQGGIAAAIGADDSPALHAADTLAVGAGLNDREAVQVLIEEGKREVQRLLAWGVPFDGGSRPDLGLEAGHSRRRILHAGGGATGAVLSEALFRRAERLAGIEVLPYTPVTRLLVEDGRVVGAASDEWENRSRAVVLATGGYAGLWGRSTNPAGNTGIGLHLAWQVGATLADLELVQFHPTALDLDDAPAYLLSEALRGEGAKLLDADGREVVDPLLPRDVVARAISRHLRAVGPVYLSMRHLDPAMVHERFRAIAKSLREWGLDLARDPIPVAPAAHYCMGGVRTDTWGRTDVPGLYSAGEVACTGVQGANRLASNSLLECLVFGRRAALAALGDETGKQAAWVGRALPGQEQGADQKTENRKQKTEVRRELDRPSSFVLRPSSLDSYLGVERDPSRCAA